MANQLVEVDGRRRVPLGRIGRKKDTRYLVREDDDGTIVLTPAVVLSEREAAVLANPALIQQLQAGIAAAKAEPPGFQLIVRRDVVGGLIHEYDLAAKCDRLLAPNGPYDAFKVAAPDPGGVSHRPKREELTVAGLAIITEACIDVKDRACVDACPVQCIYEFDPQKNVLFSEEEAGSGITETTHAPNADAIAIFGDSVLYVNLDECTSCTACYQPDVCPVGAIYSEEHLPDGSPTTAKYNAEDPNKGHDHTFFVQHSRDVFAD